MLKGGQSHESSNFYNYYNVETLVCVDNKSNCWIPESNLIAPIRIITFAYLMQNFDYISRVVRIGGVPMGGDFPIRIQSMTTTNTLDTRATVAQAIRMIEAGCEYVRITAQGVKEAENLSVIKKELKKQGFDVPLIADIHYNPKAAETAARIVEKVRINPGNYTDRKMGKVSYSDAEYSNELEKISKRIEPLIKICNQYGTAIRIGSNNGSLSERILFKYGDTPAGMVESALEFVRICRTMNFHDLVLSMKASNVKVMVQANRLLVHRMIEEGMNYPIHLGVTEAGDAEDGRIKSAAGIGPLLLDGIGDTIRVSLTEDPEFEMPVAKEIVSRFNDRKKRLAMKRNGNRPADSLNYARRISQQVENIGNGQVPVIIVSDKSGSVSALIDNEAIPDYLYHQETGTFQSLAITKNAPGLEFSKIDFRFIDSVQSLERSISIIKPATVFILKSVENDGLSESSALIELANQKGISQPIILYRDYRDMNADKILVQAAIDFSYFLVDGLIDGIWIGHKSMKLSDTSRLAFGILQATRSRITKTEYIACPSCGRTLFNIQEALQKIKSRTSHLKGLKIGVMGCCVNGPGEMADADYGYVGAGKGKITLYKGRQIIKAGIAEQEALESLVELIKKNGDWQEKRDQKPGMK